MRVHNEAYNNDSDNGDQTETRAEGASDTACIVPTWFDDSDDETQSEVVGCKETAEERKKRHARILLTFKEDNKLTQKTTDHFVDCVNYFAKNIVGECNSIFLDRLKEREIDVDEIDRDIKEHLEPLTQPFAGLETAWTQAAYFEEVFHCVVRLSKVILVENFITCMA